MNRGYEDLRVWQKSLECVKAVYRATGHFPKEEMYGLTSQIRRSAVSVPSNIAEGSARKSQKEFAQFIGVATGSLAELHTQLIISRQLGFLEKKSFEELELEIIDIRRMLSGLKVSLKDATLALVSGNAQRTTGNGA